MIGSDSQSGRSAKTHHRNPHILHTTITFFIIIMIIKHYHTFYHHHHYNHHHHHQALHPSCVLLLTLVIKFSSLGCFFFLYLATFSRQTKYHPRAPNKFSIAWIGIHVQNMFTVAICLGKER